MNSTSHTAAPQQGAKQMAKTVEVTVRLTLSDECNVTEVLQEMNYSFEHEGDIVSTEIIDANDILDEEDEDDGQPDEAQEWESFDADC
jgi:hypothetical protein